jgi:hypothetical protein
MVVEHELLERWIPALQDGLERVGAERVADTDVAMASTTRRSGAG